MLAFWNVPGLASVGGVQRTLALFVVLLSPLPLFFAFLSCYLLLVSEKGQKGDRCICAGLATSEAVSSADTRRLWQSSLWGGFCWAFAFLSWMVMLVAVLGAPWQWVAVNVPGMKRGCPSALILTLTFQKNMLACSHTASMHWWGYTDW